ncbi:hypothetical protein [Endozoicomonas atrinae]|uniref:hypothetical protein n=1 Tax=Endozoicomonas atrinae TaxID=1333660 RepID=UPI0008257ADB|nr:hypothetical protein [Endozoicomonas atrinae]
MSGLAGIFFFLFLLVLKIGLIALAIKLFLKPVFKVWALFHYKVLMRNAKLGVVVIGMYVYLMFVVSKPFSDYMMLGFVIYLHFFLGAVAINLYEYFRSGDGVNSLKPRDWEISDPSSRFDSSSIGYSLSDDGESDVADVTFKDRKGR